MAGDLHFKGGSLSLELLDNLIHKISLPPYFPSLRKCPTISKTSPETITLIRLLSLAMAKLRVSCSIHG